MINKWDRDELARLYNVEGKTLQEIGDLYGVTRECVRQVMDKLSLPRNTQRCGHNGGQTQVYKSFQDYLDGAPLRKADSRILLRFYNKLFCAECGKSKRLQLHHINYPVMKEDDVQILCKSCHKIKHEGKMPYWKQLDLCHKYEAGQSVKTLVEEYDICDASVYKIIHKIRNGLSAQKR